MSKEAKKADIALRLKVVHEGLWPCCLNCEHWRELVIFDEKGRNAYHRCSKYEMIPPPATLIVGCIHHEADIPF